MKPALRHRSPSGLPRSSVGRAELLHGLWLADQHAVFDQGLALAAGYVRHAVESEKTETKDDDKKPDGTGYPSGKVQSNNPVQAEIPRARFWAVTERVPIHVEVDNTERQTRASIPLELSDLMAAPGSAAPAWQPIAPPARLMPALKRSLQAQRLGGLDVAQLVYTLAHVKTLRRLPLRAQKGWTDRLLVVLDLSEALLPYHADMHQLASDLRRWIGRSHAKVRVIGDEHQPQGPWQEWQLDTPQAQCSQAMFGEGWEISAFASRVLLVSEMGLMARDAGQTSEAWAAWLNELGKQGADVQVWCPLPIGLPSDPELAPPGWQRAAASMPRVPAVHWSAANPLRLRLLPTAEQHRTPERLALARQLRTRLATVSRVEPALLRTLRLGLGASALDAGLEHLAWDHPDLSRHYSARALIADTLASYRAEFSKLPSTQKLKTFDALLSHHAPYNPLLAHVETLAWAAYATPDERQRRQAQIEKAMDVMQRFAHDPWQLTQLARGEVLAFMARHLRDADEPTRALCSPYMSQLMVALHRERHGNAPLTESLDGLSSADVTMALGKTPPPTPMWLTLDDEHGWLMLTHQKPADSRLIDPQPIEIRALSIGMAQQAPRWLEPTQPRDIALARLPWGLSERQTNCSYFRYFFLPFPPPVINGPIRLDTGLESITINEIPRPPWALEWARDREGLYALAPNPWGIVERLNYPQHWFMAQTQPVFPLFHMSGFIGQGGRKADALTLDLDAIGLVAGLTVKPGITQSFRYLLPGQFRIGSPNDEPDRDGDEVPQHLVTLAEDLWLADTACTQGIWQAVMGENPSHFIGDPELPVENVSWDDVQRFLAKLQAYLPTGIEAVLPTEFQWEFASRAGTTTSYILDEQISTDQVNYDGSYHYNKGHKREYRNKTVPVKAMSANAWGFYQMNGNVWEWCADDMSTRNYTDAAAADLSGATGMRVKSFAARGGVWINLAQFARSARKIQDIGVGLGSALGFRFALRYTSQQGVGPVFDGQSPLEGRDGPDFSARSAGSKK